MTEQQQYEVVERFPGFEVRRYEAHVEAEVEMTGAFERAGNAGFGPLVSYISGRNGSGAKVAMTAPVIQETVDGGDTHRVAFVMPAGASLDTLPEPAGRIAMREVPEELAAAVTYSGRWTQSAYLARVRTLLDALAAEGFEVVGRPRYARFDPPWKPPFLRRNEVVIPVARR